MYIELRLSDLRDIKDILKEIEYDLSIAINKTHQYIDNGDYLGGSYSVEVSKGMEERNSELKEAMNFIHEFDDKVSEIIELIKSKAKVTNEDVTFVYDAKKLGNNLSKIKKLLDFRGEEYKKVLNLNSTYLEWEKEVSNRLDDTLREAIKDPIEEMKQRDDEKVFRHNKRIIQGLEEKIRDITFLDCIEDMENIKKKLDGLEELDDIKDLTDILINNIRFGNASKSAIPITIFDMKPKTEFGKEINTQLEKLSELFPELDDEEVFNLLLYAIATINYGEVQGIKWDIIWSASWGRFDNKYNDELKIIKQQELYKIIYGEVRNRHNKEEFLIDPSHFSATLLTLQTGDVKINIAGIMGVQDIRQAFDTLFDNGSGWLGDYFTTAGVQDIRSDYLAIVVSNDMDNGIDLIVSIENHIKEVESIKDWESFFKEISIIDMM